MSILSLSAGMALTFGVLHALEPGHGKVAIMTYVASEKRSLKDGFVIAVSSAVTHSITVLLIAFLSHFVFHHIAVENNIDNINKILSISSGILISSIGIWYIITNKKKQKSCSSCKSHNHKNENSDFLTSGMLGIAAGLIPCPTLLIAYLAGVSSGNSLGGITNVILFALGMCFSLLSLVIISGICGEKILSKIGGKNLNLNWRLYQGFLFILIGLITATYL